MTPSRNHPSVGHRPDDVDLTAAEQAVIAAATIETHRETIATQALRRGLVAHGGTIAHIEQGITAKRLKDARNARAEAVQELERIQREIGRT